MSSLIYQRRGNQLVQLCINEASIEDTYVQVISQTLTSAQQGQARTNISACSQADMNTLTAALGDLTDTDFVSTFNAALTATESDSDADSDVDADADTETNA